MPRGFVRFRHLPLATAVCAAALALAPALAQETGPFGLRGTGGQGRGIAGAPGGTSEMPAPGGSSRPGGLAPSPFTGNTAGAAPPPDPRAEALRRQSNRLTKPPPGSARKPLPDLVPYATAPGQRQRRGVPQQPQARRPPPNVAALPMLPAPRRPTLDPDPFGPVGVDVGSLRLYPAIEASGGYDSNPNRTSGQPKGSPLWRTEGALRAQSQWSSHEFKADLRGGYTDYVRDRDASRPFGQGQADLRLDVTKTTRWDSQFKYNLDSQRPGAPELATGTPASVEGRPLVQTFGASTGLTQSFGRLEAGLRGTIDRTAYENARLSDGSRLDLASDSYNSYGVRGRLAYEVTPGIKPFVEVGVDTRKHDRRIDANGFARDSDGVTGKAGTTIEIARLITGEVSAGYTTRRYEDGRLPRLRGPVLDASLVWQASPLTTITLKGATELAETNVAGASGAVTRKASLDVSHALLRNLTVGGTLSWQDTDYRGFDLNEKTTSATLRAQYSLTRSIALQGSFTHERLKSSSPGSDYTANIYLLGLRFQR